MSTKPLTAIAFLLVATITSARDAERPPPVSSADLDSFKLRLYTAATQHLDQLVNPDGRAVELKGKSTAAQTALAFCLLGERSGMERYRRVAVALADGVLQAMRATKLGVLPIKEKEKPDGENILGGGPPALGEYVADLAYIYHREDGRDADLKYLGGVIDQFAWNENGWWAADVDVSSGQSKAPLTKPSPINKNASLVLAAGTLGEYLAKIDPALAGRLKAKADKCLYQKILPAQEGDGFWHYSLAGKDPGNKDILGYFMLTTTFFIELRYFTDSYHDPRLASAVEKAGVFAAKHIAPITDPNREMPTSGHVTPGTPAHYNVAEEPKRGFQLGVILAATSHEAEGVKVIDATLPHFPKGNVGEDGAHAVAPAALILQLLP